MASINPATHLLYTSHLETLSANIQKNLGKLTSRNRVLKNYAKRFFSTYFTNDVLLKVSAYGSELIKENGIDSLRKYLPALKKQEIPYSWTEYSSSPDTLQVLLRGFDKDVEILVPDSQEEDDYDDQDLRSSSPELFLSTPPESTRESISVEPKEISPSISFLLILKIKKVGDALLISRVDLNFSTIPPLLFIELSNLKSKR